MSACFIKPIKPLTGKLPGTRKPAPIDGLRELSVFRRESLRLGFSSGTHPQRAAGTAATVQAGLAQSVWHDQSQNRTRGIRCQTLCRDVEQRKAAAGQRCAHTTPKKPVPVGGESQKRNGANQEGRQLFFWAALLAQQKSAFSLNDSHSFNRRNYAHPQHWQHDAALRWNFSQKASFTSLVLLRLHSAVLFVLCPSVSVW